MIEATFRKNFECAIEAWEEKRAAGLITTLD